MGLPDSYVLPANYNDSYHLAGDGLAVPVVSWLERHLLTPLVQAQVCLNRDQVLRDGHMAACGSSLHA